MTNAKRLRNLPSPDCITKGSSEHLTVAFLIAGHYAPLLTAVVKQERSPLVESQPRALAILPNICFDWEAQINPKKGARYAGRVDLFADKIVFSGRTMNPGMGGCLLFGAIGALLGALVGRAASNKVEIAFSTSKGQVYLGENPDFRFEVEPGTWLVCGWGKRPPGHGYFVRTLEQIYQGRIRRV